MDNNLNYNSYHCQNHMCSNSIIKFRDPVQSKRLADRRWRKSLNICYNGLKETIAVNYFDFESNEKKIKSRISLLKNTLNFIDKMENLIEQLCHKSNSIHGNKQERLSISKFKQQFCEQEAKKYCKAKKVRQNNLNCIHSCLADSNLSFTSIK